MDVMGAKYRNDLPWDRFNLFLCHVGMETDLIFNKNVDLPGFALFPLLETELGRKTLESGYRGLLEIALRSDLGLQLDSPTWIANKDRAKELGYSPSDLIEINRESIAFLDSIRQNHGDCPTVLSANIGPRSDAYAPDDRMTVDEAEFYHSEQVAALVDTAADVVTAMTLAYSEEATGIVKAARRHHMPVVVSFTVEVDGRLPTGEALSDAIARVDEETDQYADHFLINCAHPDHFYQVIGDVAKNGRLRGIVANASRCSHAELDEAEVLDDGNPKELADQLIEMQRSNPAIFMLGGCCGTDLRHISEIAARA